jgi:hypothetical protein
MPNMIAANPVVVMPLGLKFTDLCLILDFAYLGQAQVPHESLDDFLKAGELLQIRGIKERRLNFVTAHHQPPMNRSFDSTISSTQESFGQPPTKRQREDDDISIQEASEIMKMLFENNLEIESEVQNMPAETTTIPPQPVPTFINKATVLQAPPITFYSQAPQPPRPPAPKKKSTNIGKKAQEKPKFPCRYCNRGLASQGRVAKHENECNDNPHRETIHCEYCNLELKPSSYTLHKNTKHANFKSQPPSPDYSSQPSNSPNPMNSPHSMTVNDQLSKSSIIDPLLTMSPQVSPTEQITNLNTPMPVHILKVEKIEPLTDDSSKNTEVKVEKIEK